MLINTRLYFVDDVLLPLGDVGYGPGLAVLSSVRILARFAFADFAVLGLSSFDVLRNLPVTHNTRNLKKKYIYSPYQKVK